MEYGRSMPARKNGSHSTLAVVVVLVVLGPWALGLARDARAAEAPVVKGTVVD
jgi:hypothetical protein